MSFESDVAAITSRTLWLRARDLAGSTGDVVYTWPDRDGLRVTPTSDTSTPTAILSADTPPLSPRSVRFNGSFGLGVGRIVQPVAETFASSSFSNLLTHDKAFDGNASTEWASSSTPATIGARFATAFACNEYVVQGRGGFATTQVPRDWTFEGSNNGTSWTVLDTRTAQNPTAETSYTFTNSTTYTHYRLNVSAVQTSGPPVGLKSLKMLGTGAPMTTIFGGTAGELWAVVKAVAGSTAFFKAGTGVESFYPFSDGKIYDDFGANARPGFTYTGPATSWHLVRFQQNAGTKRVWINGVLQDTTAGMTVSWPSVIGIGRGELNSGTNTTNSYVAEIVAFNGALSTGDVTKVSDYLTDKHFTSLAPPDPITGTVAGSAPLAVGSLAGTAPTTGTLAGTAPAPVGSLAGMVPATGTIAGSAPAAVGSLAGSTVFTATGTIAGTAPLGVGSLAGTVVTPSTTGTLAGVAPIGVGHLVADTGTTVGLPPWTEGTHGEALLFLDVPLGVLEVTYAATPAPATIVEVPMLRASHQMPVLAGTRLMDYPIETDVVGVPHVWVDGVDVTYFRDHPTKLAGWRQESPFGWTATTLTFPQVFHFEEPGTGDLSWMRPDAPVEIAIVRPDDTRLHRFTGQLTSDDPGVGRGRTECVWGVEGILWQAEHAHHEVPARLAPTDIGTLIPAELNGTPSRRFSPIARKTTGITSRKRGSYGDTRWGYASNLLATATRDDGRQWTLDPTGPRSFALTLKDTSAVHWTVTAGAPGVELDLSKDHHERIDAVYGRGVGPDGYAWANLFFPDLLPYDPPDYPYSDPDRNVLLGDTDADTLTGTGVSDWQRRIRDLGYTSLPVDGVMNSADIAAVYWIQRKRGIQVDGFMGPQTWAATWNIGTVGGDLDTVRLPLAVRPEVEKYLYGANGATVGRNPAYDPSIIRHEVDIDFGAGVTKEQGRELAQRILERGMDPGVAGTIKLTTCPWEGSRWEMNAGENVLLKGYRGEDVLMRVTGLDADPESLTVTLTVDSEFRDALAVVQILERNRESKADPARRPGNPSKRSRLDQDMVTPFEGESPAGRLPRMALFAGLWTVWPVPVSEIGSIARMKVNTSGPVSKFCIALFGRPITANQIDAIVPAPLTDSNPWRDQVDVLLDRYGWIETFGKDGQAAGYFPRQEGEGPITGRLDESSSVEYVSQVAPWVWVAMWSPVSTFIEGRIYPAPVQ